MRMCGSFDSALNVWVIANGLKVRGLIDSSGFRGGGHQAHPPPPIFGKFSIFFKCKIFGARDAAENCKIARTPPPF